MNALKNIFLGYLLNVCRSLLIHICRFLFGVYRSLLTHLLRVVSDIDEYVERCLFRSLFFMYIGLF